MRLYEEQFFVLFSFGNTELFLTKIAVLVGNRTRLKTRMSWSGSLLSRRFRHFGSPNAIQRSLKSVQSRHLCWSHRCYVLLATKWNSQPRDFRLREAYCPGTTFRLLNSRVCPSIAQEPSWRRSPAPLPYWVIVLLFRFHEQVCDD